MLKNISSSQQKVLQYYTAFFRNNERAPTYEEASRGLDISPSVVYGHIKNLEKKGYLKASSKKEGLGVQVLEITQGIPVLGTIACGEPITVSENMNERIDVPKTMLKGSGPFYALYAEGFSMVNAGISDKDILVIRKQDNVDDGDIAVVVLGEDENEETATLKRVYKKNNSILLKPANDKLESVMVNDCKVRGKLVGVISVGD